jgi:hypothetical protein
MRVTLDQLVDYTDTIFHDAGRLGWDVMALDNPAIADWSKRIAAPQPAPARVPAPLTDEQIDMITAEQWGKGLGAPYAAYRAYARAIEAAHGITATEA